MAGEHPRFSSPQRQEERYAGNGFLLPRPDRGTLNLLDCMEEGKIAVHAGVQYLEGHRPGRLFRKAKYPLVIPRVEKFPRKFIEDAKPGIVKREERTERFEVVHVVGVGQVRQKSSGFESHGVSLAGIPRDQWSPEAFRLH